MPILLLHVHNRCNCRCTMCDIWKRTTTESLSRAHLEAQQESLVELGVEQVVFTGGEPLMNTNLPELTEFFRSLGVRCTLLTSGLLLERHAQTVARGFDEVILSLDGPPAVHAAIRGVPGIADILLRGVIAVRSQASALPVHARCTVQRRNFRNLCETVATAVDLGLNSISFLAADLDSTAFNRELVWPGEKRKAIGMDECDLHSLRDELTRLDEMRHTLPPHFRIVEDRAKLQRIADHFFAKAGLRPHRSPTCNAPWVSAVWETNGEVRPCFFQPPVGSLENDSLRDVVNGTNALAFRAALDNSNEICKRCVCSLNYRGPSPALSA